MKKEIILNGVTVSYDFQCKNVKNINLRIKPDGSVCVSASRRVPQSEIEGFLKLKADFILRALQACQNKKMAEKTQYFTETQIRSVIFELCKQAYPYYEKRGIRFPQIKFRRMVSVWGSCRPKQGILTFNTNLIYAPPECVEYVVWHEFTHFLQANHSPLYYKELEQVCPDWKECRRRLREINIRGEKE